MDFIIHVYLDRLCDNDPNINGNPCTQNESKIIIMNGQKLSFSLIKPESFKYLIEATSKLFFLIYFFN